MDILPSRNFSELTTVPVKSRLVYLAQSHAQSDFKTDEQTDKGSKIPFRPNKFCC